MKYNEGSESWNRCLPQRGRAGNPRWKLFMLGAVLMLFMGCTPEKALQIRNGANQFRAQAFEAISAISQLLDSEIAPAPRTETQKHEEFVSNILSLPASINVTSEVMEMALDPYTVNLSSSELKSRDDFIGRLRGQYIEFASIFDDLERGSFLARNKVSKAKDPGVKLVAQLVGFADSISKNPPRLLQQRTAILAEMNRTRKDVSLQQDERERQLAMGKEQWETLKAKEEDLQRSVIEKCLTAAMSGKEVLRLIDNYKKFSLEDISKVCGRMIDTAEKMSGKSLIELRSQSTKMLNDIRQDPLYNQVIERVLSEIQTSK